MRTNKRKNKSPMTSDASKKASMRDRESEETPDMFEVNSTQFDNNSEGSHTTSTQPNKLTPSGEFENAVISRLDQIIELLANLLPQKPNNEVSAKRTEVNPELETLMSIRKMAFFNKTRNSMQALVYQQCIDDKEDTHVPRKLHEKIVQTDHVEMIKLKTQITVQNVINEISKLRVHSDYQQGKMEQSDREAQRVIQCISEPAKRKHFADAWTRRVAAEEKISISKCEEKKAFYTSDKHLVKLGSKVINSRQSAADSPWTNRAKGGEVLRQPNFGERERPLRHQPMRKNDIPHQYERYSNNVPPMGYGNTTANNARNIPPPFGGHGQRDLPLMGGRNPATFWQQRTHSRWKPNNP